MTGDNMLGNHDDDDDGDDEKQMKTITMTMIMMMMMMMMITVLEYFHFNLTHIVTLRSVSVSIGRHGFYHIGIVFLSKNWDSCDYLMMKGVS